jgi:hypothetical protein
MKINLIGSLNAIVLLMLIFAFTTNKANSQVKENSAIWESMKYGIFVHFVNGGEYGGMTPLNLSGGFPTDIDDFANNFDVQKFANDLQAMGFEYVIFIAWHVPENKIEINLANGCYLVSLSNSTELRIKKIIVNN